MPHDIEKVKLVNNFFGADPNFQKLPQLMKVKLKPFILKALMKLPSFPGFGLKHKIFFDECFNLLLGGYLGDILPDIDQRAVAFQLILNEFCENELNLRIKFPNFQTFQIFLFKLSDHIRIIGNHGF